MALTVTANSSAGSLIEPTTASFSTQISTWARLVLPIVPTIGTLYDLGVLFQIAPGRRCIRWSRPVHDPRPRDLPILPCLRHCGTHALVVPEAVLDFPNADQAVEKLANCHRLVLFKSRRGCVNKPNRLLPLPPRHASPLKTD